MPLMPSRVRWRKVSAGRCGASRSAAQRRVVRRVRPAVARVGVAGRRGRSRPGASRPLPPREGRVFIRVFPHKPVSGKPLETRMGKGKGEPEFWVAMVKPGTVIFEITGVTEEKAILAFKRVAHKLPIIGALISQSVKKPAAKKKAKRPRRREEATRSNATTPKKAKPPPSKEAKHVPARPQLETPKPRARTLRAESDRTRRWTSCAHASGGLSSSSRRSASGSSSCALPSPRSRSSRTLKEAPSRLQPRGHRRILTIQGEREQAAVSGGCRCLSRSSMKVDEQRRERRPGTRARSSSASRSSIQTR